MLTPEQTRDLVDWAGTNVAAGSVVGVNESTIRYWLDPGPLRAQSAEHSLNDYHRHSERRKARVQQRRGRLKASGICVACGKEPRLTEIYCWTCTEKNNERQRLVR
jgi:hypothetical protein